MDKETQIPTLSKTAVSSSFSLKLQIFFLSPLWFFSTSVTRKSWAEFKSGLIKHNCEFDYSQKNHNDGKYYKCKHFGCNIISMKNEDGTWV